MNTPTPIPPADRKESNYSAGHIRSCGRSRHVTTAVVAALVIVGFALWSWGQETAIRTLHLKNRAGRVTTFVVPRNFVNAADQPSGSTVNRIALAFAYPSMNALGAPGTALDRSVVLAYFHEAHYSIADVIQRDVPRWTRLPSNHSELEHYISEPNLAKMEKGIAYFDDLYVVAHDRSVLIQLT
jgi:hypothetical protein